MTGEFGYFSGIGILDSQLRGFCPFTGQETMFALISRSQGPFLVSLLSG